MGGFDDYQLLKMISSTAFAEHGTILKEAK